MSEEARLESQYAALKWAAAPVGNPRFRIMAWISQVEGVDEVYMAGSCIGLPGPNVQYATHYAQASAKHHEYPLPVHLWPIDAIPQDARTLLLAPLAAVVKLVEDYDEAQKNRDEEE